MENYPIDFVVEWVDGSDPEWVRNRNKYYSANNERAVDNSNIRYRDWGFLKYWFRSIEKNAPWVNKIFFVTCGQKPEWLNENNPKLKLVNHSDYIESQYLPLFNSSAIELSLHKIPELSEHFVFFNDDFFLNSSVKKSDFFTEKGIPMDSGVLSPELPVENSVTHIATNDVQLINKYFSRKDVISHLPKFLNAKYGKQNVKTLATLPWKIILGFHDFHLAISFRKKIFEEVWEKEHENLTETLTHRFRTDEDLNVWIFRYFQLLQGEFKPRNVSFGKYYSIGNQNDELLEDIKESKHKLIVLNDQNVDDFLKVKKELTDSFEKKYPQKSSFEKQG